MKKLFLLLSMSLGLCLTMDAQSGDITSPVTAPIKTTAQETQNVFGAGDRNDMGGSYQGDYSDWYAQHDQWHQGENHGNWTGYSQPEGDYHQPQVHYGEGAIDASQEYCCGAPKEHPCGECYCLYCKYEPCYYNTYRTVCEARPCSKKCCRYVPKYYEKCCVRYVPQNYTQTCCKYEPEYYYVNDCKYVNKRVCDRHCKYIPKYYYKKTCTPPQACCPAPSNCCE